MTHTSLIDSSTRDDTARSERIDRELVVAANRLRIVTPETRHHVTRRADELLDERLAARLSAASAIHDAGGNEWTAADLAMAAERGAAYLARQVLPALDPSDPRD